MRKFLPMLVLFACSWCGARYIDSTEQDALQELFNVDGYAASLWGEYYAYGATDVAYWAGRSEACYSSATVTHSYNESLDLASALWDLCNTCYYLGLIEPNAVIRANLFGLGDGFNQEGSYAAGL